ncbi:MAG: hypothetical protein JSS95_15645 [Acidobacteria bacterium]|nr:hypothetical protein [Acidobacteriota bacterium]
MTLREKRLAMVHTLIVLLLFVALFVSPCLVAATVDLEEEENNYPE